VTPPVVLGEKKRLPKTGAGVGSMALLGAVMLMAGALLTHVRVRPVRTVFAGRGTVAKMVEAFGLRLLSRGTKRAIPMRM
jgi:LPXTG-motif cell wall-anchored protein